MTAVALRQWRGVKPVVGPCGVAISTRLCTTPDDEHVLDLVAEHLGTLRRADLARVCRPVAVNPGLDGEAKRRVRRDRLNARKKALTASSSARWANAIIAANDDQYRLARDAQYRHIIGLRAAIATIGRRLAQPSGDTLTPEQRRTSQGTERLSDPGRKVRQAAPSAGLAGRVGPRHHPISRTGGCVWWKAVNGWPRPATTSTPQA